MTEMNELTRSLVRVEELILQGASSGAQHVLWTAQEYARQAVKLISDQSKAMTEQALKIKELTERLDYWQNRAESAEVEVSQQSDQVAQLQQWLESAEAEIKELDEQEPIVWRVIDGEWHTEDFLSCNPENCGDMVKVTPLYARPVPSHKFELEIQRLVAMNDSLLANEKRLIESLRSRPAKAAPDDGETMMIED